MESPFMSVFHVINNFTIQPIQPHSMASTSCGCCREIGRMDPRDLNRDTSGTRAYADFLVELASRVPSQIIPSISVLLCHLNGEVC